MRGSRVRALSRAGSTAARSPPGERRSPTSGLAGGAAPPAGRRTGHCSRSVLVQKETGERNEWR
jgi:hypothetical protein